MAAEDGWLDGWQRHTTGESSTRTTRREGYGYKIHGEAWCDRDSSTDSVISQVLAEDLLNPTPAAEARKHKLKVRFASMDG